MHLPAPLNSADHVADRGPLIVSSRCGRAVLNTVLLPLQAATRWFFCARSAREAGHWAAAAGAMAAVADRQAPYCVFPFDGAQWITIAMLASHLVWLAQNDFAPFSFATAVHGVKPFATTLVGALG